MRGSTSPTPSRPSSGRGRETVDRRLDEARSGRAAAGSPELAVVPTWRNERCRKRASASAGRWLSVPRVAMRPQLARGEHHARPWSRRCPEMATAMRTKSSGPPMAAAGDADIGARPARQPGPPRLYIAGTRAGDGQAPRRGWPRPSAPRSCSTLRRVASTVGVLARSLASSFIGAPRERVTSTVARPSTTVGKSPRSSDPRHRALRCTARHHSHTRSPSACSRHGDVGVEARAAARSPCRAAGIPRPATGTRGHRDP